MRNKNFAERVLKIRNDKGFSQKKIFEISGINQGFLSEVEQGKATPSSNFFILFYQKFDVDLNWLLTGEGETYIGKKPCEIDDCLAPGERLKKCRKLLKLTQDELGQKIKSSHSFICSVEKNKFSMGAEFLYELNQQLNVNINWLLAGDGPMFLNAERPATAATPQSDPGSADQPGGGQTDKSQQLTPEEIQALRDILKIPHLKSIISKIDNNPSISPEEILMLEAIRTKSYIKSIVLMADNMSDEERNNLFAYIAEKMRISDLKHGSAPNSEDMPDKKRA